MMLTLQEMRDICVAVETLQMSFIDNDTEYDRLGELFHKLDYERQKMERIYEQKKTEMRHGISVEVVNVN